MPDAPLSDPGLIALKWLVIALTATMTVGIVVLVILFWMRLPEPLPPLPESIAMPEGETATAFTRGRGFLAVVTADDEILVFDPSGRTLRQRIALEK
jgi:hypothetical protein